MVPHFDFLNLQISVNDIDFTCHVNLIFYAFEARSFFFSLSLSPWNANANMNAAFCMINADDLRATLSVHAKLSSCVLPKAVIMVIIIYGPWPLSVPRIEGIIKRRSPSKFLFHLSQIKDTLGTLGLKEHTSFPVLDILTF